MRLFYQEGELIQQWLEIPFLLLVLRNDTLRFGACEGWDVCFVLRRWLKTIFKVPKNQDFRNVKARKV